MEKIKGLCLKEIGNRIGDGTLARDYPKTHIQIAKFYYDEVFRGSGYTKHAEALRPKEKE
jgi:hypothetical protein